MAGIDVVVIDDHPMTRQGVVEILAAHEGLRVVGEGRTADDAVRMALELRPRVMLLDTDISGGGIEATRAILALAEGQRPAIIMLTEEESEDMVCAALEAGARGYLPKSRHKSELARVVRTVAAGETYVSPDLAGRLLLGRAARSMMVRRVDAAAIAAARDAQIMRLVSRGYSNREIAAQLHLPEATITSCVARVVDRIADARDPGPPGWRDRPSMLQH